MRDIASSHLKAGKNFTEVAFALRVICHSVMRWLTWFAWGGADRWRAHRITAGTQRRPKAPEEVFHQAVDQLEHSRGGGRVRGGASAGPRLPDPAVARSTTRTSALDRSCFGLIKWLWRTVNLGRRPWTQPAPTE